MAQRIISTKLAIEGESQYIASLSRINGEMKTLNTNLKLTESEFLTNANSMEALTAKSEALDRLYKAQTDKVKELEAALRNARDAEQLYASVKQELLEQIAANEKALARLRESTEDTAAEQERLTAENKELNAELERNAPYLEAAAKGVNTWQGKLNTAKIELNELNAKVELNREYLNEARKSQDNCASSIDRFGQRAQAASQKAQELTDSLAAAGLIVALKATADALRSCAEDSITFESAMAGVKKTTDMTDAELAEMAESIKSMKIPATPAEIAAVAEAAGQLGIAKGDILAFSEVMVNLGTATNLSSDEAATALAKFANVVGMSAENYERLGSTIVALGNNFATTEADIVSMATRLASTGSMVGLTEAEIMAVATALSSVGIEAEAGGSAISKLLKQFEVMVQTGAPELASFAEVAGMSAQEFSEAWGESAVTALSYFIDGLGRVDRAGGSSVAVLENLGLTEIRLSNAVQSLTTSEGILEKALGKANTAWKENTALSKEAETRYSTTESKLQMLSNSAGNVKIAIGDDLTPAIGSMADTLATACDNLADFINENQAVVPVVASTAVALGTLAIGITGIATASKVAEAAVTLFNLATAASPVGVAVTAVAALAAGLTTLALTAKNDAVPSVTDLTTAVESMNEALAESEKTRKETVDTTLATASVADHYIEKLKALEAAGLKTDQQAQEYHNTLALLCQLVPELSNFINLETDTIKGGTAALEANTQAWKKNAIAQAYQEQFTAVSKEYAAVLVEQQKNSIGLTQSIERQRIATEHRAAAEQRMMVLLDEAKEKARELNAATGGTVEATSFLTDEYYALERSLYEYDSEVLNATRSAEAYKAAMDADAEAVEAAKNELDETAAAIEDLTNAQADGADAAAAYGDTQDTATQRTAAAEEAVRALKAAYQEAYETAKTSINGQIGLFDSFAAAVSEDTDTVEEMMQRWAEQTANLAAYTENLRKAAQYGIDDGLVASLSDGSAESAAYLGTIIDEIERLGGTAGALGEDAEAFVSEFNAAFEATTKARDTLAATIASMETDLLALPGMFRQAGVDSIDGMIVGIQSREDRLRSAMGGVVNSGFKAATQVAQIASPSKRATRMFEFVGDGMVLGAENRRQKLKSTMQSIVDDAMSLETGSKGRAVMDEIDVSMPAVSKAVASHAAAVTNSTVIRYDKMEVNVYQQPNEDSTAFAYRLMDIVQLESEKKGAAING